MAVRNSCPPRVPRARAYVGVSGALGDPQGTALAARVATDPRWIEVGSDGGYRLYRREEASTR